MLLEIPVGAQPAASPSLRRGRQLEYLEGRPIKGDEVHIDEAVAGLDVVVEGHSKDAADPVVGVVAHASAVTAEHQE